MIIETIKTFSELKNIGRKNYSELRVCQLDNTFQIMLFLGTLTETNFCLADESLLKISEDMKIRKHKTKDASYLIDDVGNKFERTYLICDNKDDLIETIGEILQILESKLTKFSKINYEGACTYIKFDDLKKIFPEIERI